MRVGWQTIGTLNIRVRAGQVRKNLRCGREPRTATSRDDGSQHVSLAACFHLQLRSHSFAHHTRSILGKVHFASFVQNHIVREATFATMFFLSTFYLTVLHRLSLAIHELMPMVLNVVEDELDVCFVLFSEASGVILDTLHVTPPCGPKEILRGQAM